MEMKTVGTKRYAGYQGQQQAGFFGRKATGFFRTLSRSLTVWKHEVNKKMGRGDAIFYQ